MGSFSMKNLEAHRRFNRIVARAMELDPDAFKGRCMVEVYTGQSTAQMAAMAMAAKEIDGELATD
jgi:hypothetical protein